MNSWVGRALGMLAAVTVDLKYTIKCIFISSTFMNACTAHLLSHDVLSENNRSYSTMAWIDERNNKKKSSDKMSENASSRC